MTAAAPVPVVSLAGRQVTVTFDLPFLPGDECITPRNYQKTAVRLLPEIVIHLGDNLQKARVDCWGAWYTVNHTQVHGLAEFLPDMNAFLEFWLSCKDRAHYEDRLTGLRHMFKDEPAALARLDARHMEMLQAEITAEKAALGNHVVLSAQKVTRLEAALTKLGGAT